MEETELKYHFKATNLPAGVNVSYKVLTDDATGHHVEQSGTLSSAETDFSNLKFAKVADGDSDHQYTGYRWVELSVGDAALTSNVVDTEVCELWIKSFKDAASGKEWKVCVGDNISYDAISASGLTEWSWMLEQQPGAGAGSFFGWDLQNANAQRGGTAKIPQSNLHYAGNGWFGTTYGTVTVKAKDPNGNWYTFKSTDDNGRKASVFFDPDKPINWGTASSQNPPAWFVFWQQAGAGSSAVTYDPNLGATGLTSYYTDIFGSIVITDVKVGPGASGSDVLGGACTLIGGGTLNGGTISGIDLFHITVRHELKHVSDLSMYSGGSADADGDRINDVYEAASPLAGSQQTSVTAANTWLLSCPSPLSDIEYRAYWSEVNVWRSEIGSYNNVDWSKGGKQWD
jgi:hypothetical protein